ncbi:ABC transporter permease [Herbiconiux moechotypicola]|uniref:ABC transporter permease n=1 Tax=Herbiconiux moechotypicola TaxID=637393 RepID=A0ABP5QFF3_9MICO|nr:ABC transporter permease [Herbiconiux moechotypicola]MCS5730000.1 ABC transporter permease [Herbiconiux moechotypicola]
MTTPPAPRRRFGVDFATVLASPAVLFGVAVFLVPVIVILVRSLTDPSPATYADAVTSDIFLRSIWTTFRMAVCVTAVCLLVSYPYAWALARGPKAVRIVLLGAVLLSFWTSTLVRTYAWQILLNNTGVINSFLIDSGLISDPLPLIRTDFAVYVGMAHILAPFTILTLYTQLTSIKPEVEQAAASLGASPTSVFWRITLPLSLPGAAAGGVLVFILSLGFYITPEVLGNSRELYLGSVIVQQIQVLLNSGTGAAMSIVLLVMVVAVLLLVGRFVGLGRILGIRRGDR